MGALNTLVVLGPTASGKTRLGVALARALGGEIVSADSRQVYRGLVIGAGKDLDEYVQGGPPVPYHLIDCVGLDHEYSVFEYQRDFYAVFESLRARATLPVVVGGTGLYLDAVLRGYRMVEAPECPELRTALASLSLEQLAVRLSELRGALHNTTDLTDRARLVRAIEIAEYSRTHPPEPAPEVNALLLGTRWPRPVLHRRIADRLRDRLNGGLIEEVQGLLDQGVPLATLHFLGLEYRYVAAFLTGEIRSRNDLFQKLAAAIGQFAKRQETWFRRMERQGQRIVWIDAADTDRALAVALDAGFPRR